VVLQLGGRDPQKLACQGIRQPLELPLYDSINVYCGCPSTNAVGGRSGGASLAKCVEAMPAAAAEIYHASSRT
jgi:tRNA-dihydrouridine synthase